MLRDLICKKQKAMQDGEAGNADLLGLLLQCKEEKGNDMTIEDVIEECKQFYLAGQENTALWLTWTLILLSMHPAWQEKARQEVLRICGKSPPEMDILHRLNIVSVNMLLTPILFIFASLIAKIHRNLLMCSISLVKGSMKLSPSSLNVAIY